MKGKGKREEPQSGKREKRRTPAVFSSLVKGERIVHFARFVVEASNFGIGGAFSIYILRDALFKKKIIIIMLPSNPSNSALPSFSIGLSFFLCLNFSF